MVIPDWTSPKPPKVEFEAAPNSSAQNMARPVDRLAAVIVDVFVLLVPIYILLSAPFKRWLTASFILGSEPDFMSLLLIMVVMAVVLIVSYQATMHYYFGATLGKMLFELKVRSTFEDEKLTFSNCVGRAFVWIFECLCLCLPFLAVFTNRQRRTLHDRISDTCVVTGSGSSALSPLPLERGLVRGFFGAAILFLFMIGSFQVHHFLDRMKAERGVTTAFEKDLGECEVVTKNLPAQEEGEHARLELAMSLYAAGLAERTCLESELEREMATQVPVGAVTYLAQAFVNADDAEVSNSYLDQVCEDSPSTVECAMSKVVSRWSDEDWGAVETLLDGAPRGSGYLEVWAVRHHMKQAHYNQALAFLDSLSDHHELAEFSLVQRVKALFNSYMESEATAALAQALPSLSKEEGDDLGAWMCAQQLQNGCSALQKISCRDVPQTKETSEIDFEHSASALSRVMALECQAETGVDYLTFSEAVRDEDWQTFFRANLKHQKDDNQAAYKLFTDVITSNSTPELLRIEAVRRVSQFASRQQMAHVVDMWKTFESKDSWIKSGNLLFTRLTQKKDKENAMRVARDLMNAESLSPAALAQLTDMAHAPEQDRKPASVHAKEEIKTLIESYEEE
ncbi:MAG: RDD family protein [Bdellovibrionales bacterium]